MDNRSNLEIKNAISSSAAELELRLREAEERERQLKIELDKKSESYWYNKAHENGAEVDRLCRENTQYLRENAGLRRQLAEEREKLSKIADTIRTPPASE